MRKIKIATEKYYHVYNRGANQQEIFLAEKDYFRFLWKMWEFNNKSTSKQRWYLKNKERMETKVPETEVLVSGTSSAFKLLTKLPRLVEIICYNLLPNHYHFILKQLTDRGIETFMRKLGIGYANYFNAKYNRTGVLFERRFEAYPINNDNKLCQLSAYVNCNYEIHKLGRAEDWSWSSYQDYLDIRQGKLINKNIVFELFNYNIQKYREYCQLVIRECQDIKKVRKMFER